MIKNMENIVQPLADEVFRDISESLSRGRKPHWGKVPRIYVVLKSINDIQAIDAFINQGILDLWFPFTQQTLPEVFRDQTSRKNFLEKQKVVFSKVLDIERASKHHHFLSDSDVPLVTVVRTW